MSYLVSTYGFSIGGVVQAKARAHNTNGYGGYSNVNSIGGTIQTAPTSAPTLSEGSGTTSSSAEITWTDLTGVQPTGNNAIISYNLEWD